MKLDLGSGPRPAEGFEGVDIVPCEGVKHVVDLWQFPWPWENDSVDELRSSHFLEHTPACYVTPGAFRDGSMHDEPRPHVHLDEGGTRHYGCEHTHGPIRPTSKEMLFAILDEAWRILRPGGTFFVIVPAGSSNNADGDPTHRRRFFPETFFYFDKKWREENGVGHYRADCDFELRSLNAAAPEGETGRQDRASRASHLRNTVIEYRVMLRARKPAREVPVIPS